MPTMLFTALQNYAGFTGRARRKEYWQFVLLNLLLGIGAGILDNLLGLIAANGIGTIGLLVSLAMLVPGIAVGVRRMHDTNHSGWWIIVPIVNLVFAVTDGTRGANDYGPDPKGFSGDRLQDVFR